MPFSLLDYSLQFVNNKCCEHSQWQKGLLLPSVEHFGVPRKKIFAVSNPDTRFLLDFVLDPNTTDGLLIASQDFWSTEFTTGPEIWVLCLVQFACLGPLVATQHRFTSNHICLTQNSFSSDHLILLNAAHFSHCSAFSFDAALHNWEGREI